MKVKVWNLERVKDTNQYDRGSVEKENYFRLEDKTIVS